MRLQMTCNGTGIFSIGNIKPVNNIVGTNIPIIEISIAACCDCVTFEINKPKDKAEINLTTGKKIE